MKQKFTTIARLLGLAAALLLAWPVLAIAQESESPPFEVSDLPGSREMAAALSDDSSRVDTLLTFITVTRSVQNNALFSVDQLSAIELQFRDDRAWLDRLALRYATLPTRSTILDPAAWFVQQELGQHSVRPGSRVSPMGPDYSALLTQLFDRSDERLAAVYLPEVMFLAEFIAVSSWQALLQRASEDEAVLMWLASLNADWFDPWTAAEPPAPVSTKPADPLELALASLQAQMLSILRSDPPDALRIKRLKFTLLSSMPDMSEAEAQTASQVLRLAGAIDGLHDYRYLEFIESLLWVVSDVLDMYLADTDAWSPLPGLLAEFLPELSLVMARSFSEVDARFNANLAATYDVVQDLNSGDLTGARLDRLLQELADTVAQLVLLVPDLAFYFDQPVRRQISEEIDICISIAANRDEEGKPQLTRAQFDGCIQSLSGMADTMVRRAELAGDSDGPFGVDQLQRELEMTPWQRVNYAIGYLHERSPGLCALPEQSLPNPLEWSALATLLVWFSAQSPVYFQTPENEKHLIKLRKAGLDFLRLMSQQVDCLGGTGGSATDIISATAQQYRDALTALTSGIRAAELEFRQANLGPGADVVLGGKVSQKTSYRTQGLTIGPCVMESTCEMTQNLEATRALVGRFPDYYLLASQTGLGDVEICYDNMQWVDRRAELVRPQDPNVANYYGHLSFDLVGRFRQGDVVESIFGSNFVSPDEYHYLIAAASDEILEDGCPTEYVGTRVVTQRNSDTGFSIVPNRLTYLAAARSRPSEVILANWAKGEEWRDWFVTGMGVEEIVFSPDAAIRNRLERHLRVLYQSQQKTIYRNLLRPSAQAPEMEAIPLFDLVQEVSIFKQLLGNQLNLFYPEIMLDSDDIRSVLEGQGGLLDETVLRRMQENGVELERINEFAFARLQEFQEFWMQQPDVVVQAGSVSTPMAHALLRLNELYREYFSAPAPTFTPPETATPVEVNMEVVEQPEIKPEDEGAE